MENIKYAIYARKSSEQDEKQAASIEAQKKELCNLAERDGIEISLILEESHSAKDAGARPVFNQLIELIKNGEITGLLAWHPNRLSRNTFDLAVLTQLVQEGKLHSIKTPSQTFENDPMQLFMLLLAVGQAKMENDNKGIDVKRGLRAKVEMGVYPSQAPLGYTNDKFSEKGNKKIFPDEERFKKVRKLFDWMLSGKYTPPQILEMANKKLGLRSKNGKKISRSAIYHIFHNPFYYGEFEYPLNSGNRYNGIHKPMITKTEFNRIQTLFGKNRLPNSKKKKAGTFKFRGIVYCGECGAMITAEEKFKRPKNGNVHRYVYYHCTKRKDPDCKQGLIREEKLEELLLSALDEVVIPKELHIWVIKELKKRHEVEIRERSAQIGVHRKQYDTAVQKLDNLIKMRANGELTEDEFKTSKEALATEKDHFKRMLEEDDGRIDHWIKVAENCFNFAKEAKSAFVNGELETKINIFSTLCSNLTLKDNKLTIYWAIPFETIKKMVKVEKTISKRLEPQKTLMTQSQKGDLYSKSSEMLRRQDSNLRPIA